MRQLRLSVVIFGLVTACTTNNVDNLAPVGTVTVAPVLTATPSTATPIPTVEVTPQEPDSLTLWIPDVLIPQATDDETTNLLNQQIADFAAAEPDNEIAIEIRRKSSGRDAGGILPTLRSAKEVAPGAVPDVTLVNREDLLAAVQADDDLVQPMDRFVSAAIISNLFTAALRMGQVEDELYGLPYTLEIQHVAYRRGSFPLPDTRFATVLDNQIPFLFPAQRATGLSPVFLAQYTAAGGGISQTGTIILDEDALRSTFQFYEDAVNADLISQSVTGYTRPIDYRNVMLEGQSGIALVNTQLYLGLVGEGMDYSFASIPTEPGIATTSLSGWMWIITATDPNRQLIASAFLEWMMNAENQGEYARALHMLPSQRTAFRGWYSDEYTAFVTDVMENANLPLTDAPNSTVARAMQTALVGILNGDLTAEAATRQVMREVPSTSG